MTVLPYNDKEKSKKEQVGEMFDNISGRYDFLNHFLSAGIDVYWRKKAINILKKEKPERVLDVATGTADFAIEAIQTGAKEIVGVDISSGMLEVGKTKIRKAGLDGKIRLALGDSERLDFPDNYFDAVIVAFGVRNFEFLEKGLEEMRRVLRKDGMLIVLEISQPTKFPFNKIYSLYFKFILPILGRMISKDHRAYSYLPESVQKFPSGLKFINILNKIGFNFTQWQPLTFGISSLYIGKK